MKMNIMMERHIRVVLDRLARAPGASNPGRIWPMRQSLLRAEEGSSLLELALVLPVLCLMLMGTADFGRAYYLNIEVSRAAYAGAVYGSQTPSDTSGMQAAAVADAADVPGFSTSNVTATTGCECSDGSSVSTNCSAIPSCSANAVTFVEVSTSFSYQSMLPYPGIPSPLTLKGLSRMRAAY